MAIVRHGPEAFAQMRVAGRVAAGAMAQAGAAVAPGTSTAEIDRIVEASILAEGGLPATKGILGFPAAACISVNHTVCHGIPGARKLAEGDLVKIAFKAQVDGWHAGICRTFHAGTPTPRGRLLALRAERALAAGLAVLRPGVTLGDLGHAIQQAAEARVEGVGFAVLRDLGGHGIGREFFMEPHVAHHGRPGEGDVLEEGMFLSVQPILVAGKPATKTLPDGWSVVTRDRAWSAQAEDTVGITADGVEVFTRPG
ncbi:type I methionyl aminopeptidase [Geminicoccus roseus]|uniref:type I methionyl aminopeptidase n=1 Tax=Geminicoccus roseus TaxID=404900 RepID=UPI0003F85216|nr:type I methionyl aminopeptidase [Geminicoccus roseus]